MSAVPYASGAEQIAAELAWLDHALLALVRASASAAAASTGGHGWFVSTAEAEALLDAGDDLDPDQVEMLRAGRCQIPLSHQDHLNDGGSAAP